MTWVESAPSALDFKSNTEKCNKLLADIHKISLNICAQAVTERKTFYSIKLRHAVSRQTKYDVSTQPFYRQTFDLISIFYKSVQTTNTQICVKMSN